MSYGGEHDSINPERAVAPGFNQTMKDQLGIVFLHYDADPVTENNLRSIRSYNAGATIVTVSSGAPLPGGYSLTMTPALHSLHAALPQKSSDRMLCSWFLQRREVCDKWWVVEWDVFCAVSVRDYYRPVWEFPFVAASVRLPHREPEWFWFRKAKSKWRRQRRALPESYEPFATGAVPFLYLLSEPALKAVCTQLLEDPIQEGNAELRFASAARRCGYPPCGFSPPDDQITWMNWETLPENPTIVHPVKRCFDWPPAV